ncbi:MAG: hypothetical protein H7138_18910 [Myxococcales bacterium]|nr:hypothetical protein [Myxococcales bacterium]
MAVCDEADAAIRQRCCVLEALRYNLLDPSDHAADADQCADEGQHDRQQTPEQRVDRVRERADLPHQDRVRQPRDRRVARSIGRIVTRWACVRRTCEEPV